MRILTLNAWAGKVHGPLMTFLLAKRQEVDVFCFQEMFFGEVAETGPQGERTNICQEIASGLPDFTCYQRFAPEGSLFQGQSIAPELRMGIAIFVRKTLHVIADGGCYTYPENSETAKNPRVTMTGNFQYIVVNGEQPLLIGNLHGLWQPEGKMDTAARLEQYEILNTFLAVQPYERILCGDFNTLPHTQGLAILEEKLTNWVIKTGVTSTRSPLYTKNTGLFADYILTSPNLPAHDFQVLPDVVSDHLPLIIDIF